MAVDDPDRFVQELGAAVAETPGILNFIAHVFAAQRSFDFATVEEFEKKSRALALAWAPLLAWSIYTLAAWRWLSYLAQSRYDSWEQWLAYQQALLPDALITPLSQGVGVLWQWFTH